MTIKKSLTIVKERFLSSFCRSDQRSVTFWPLANVTTKTTAAMYALALDLLSLFVRHTEGDMRYGSLIGDPP